MRFLLLVLAIGFVREIQGVFDDAHVEQYQSPFVAKIDPGTHLTNRNTGAREFQAIESSPYSSSSRQEFHEEQRYVNGQPVFEKKHERRYENGQLIYEDGFEKGSRELAAAEHDSGKYHGGSYSGSAVGSSYPVSTGGSSYRESSQSSYSSSSTEGQDSLALASQHGGTSSSLKGQLHSDIERLRQRLHAGTALPQGPIRSSTFKEERNQESHYIDGQEVYHKNQERKFEDGRLVHDELDERGNRNFEDGGDVGLQNSQISSQSSRSSSSYDASTDGQQYGPSNTAYRASYSRPGPQSRRTSTSSRRITSSGIQSNVPKPSTASVRTSSGTRTPYQSSYQSSTNRQRQRVYNSRPAYRASYTPSSSIERVAQSPSLNSASSLSSTTNQRQSSSSYQNRNNYATERPQTYSIDYSAHAGRQELSHSNKPQTSASVSSENSRIHQSYNQQSSYRPRVIYRPSSQTSSSERTSYVATHGTGGYTRSTESPNSGTTSRITDTYSEPYSVRSPSYQPSSFSSYSAWSHWNKEAGQPSQVYSSRSSTDQSRYQTDNAEVNTERTDQFGSSRIDYSGNALYSQQETNRGRPSSGSTYYSRDENDRERLYSSGSYSSQQETDREGTYYGSSYNPQNENRVGTGYSASSYSSQEENSRVRAYPDSTYSSQQDIAPTLSPEFLYDGYDSSTSSLSSNSLRNLPSSEQSSSSSYSSSSSSQESSRAVGASPSQSLDLSLTFDVGEGESVRVTSDGAQRVDNQDERYDINPLVDGESRRVMSETGSGSSSGSVSIGASGSGTRRGASGSTSLYRESSTSESSQSSTGAASGTRYIPAVYPSGSSYGSARVTNKTTNTVTSHIQPLISSYKLETRTSRRYLNGMLVSETKFNRYYENGQLVHENQTIRSRDEMETEGINVAALDLTLEDLERYRIAESGSIPMSHSQRYEMTQEKEFVDGSQIYESTHEKHFEDGKLIHEEHDERDQSELENEGRSSVSSYNSGHAYSSSVGNSEYRPQVNLANTYERNSESSQGVGRISNTGSRQYAGVGEGITVSVSPRTVTRKTEIRREQEYKDGQQVYDLHHEKQYEGGSLVHEDLIEKGPEELGTQEHRDALRDILSGRTLNTASQSRYESSSNYAGGAHYGGGSYDASSLTNSQRVGDASYGSNYESSSGYNSNDYSSSGSVNGEGSKNRIGSSLLTSGSLTSVIGGGSVEDFNSLQDVNSLQSETSSSTDAGSSRTYGGGYYSTINGGSGSGYGGATYSSRSEAEQRSQVAEHKIGTDGNLGVNSAFGSFSAEVNPGQSHRREMEVEEHYQDGKLVRGREKEQEWKNDQLLRHDVRHYGENDMHGQLPRQSGSSSSHQSYSQSSGSSYGQPEAQTGSLGAQIGTYGVQTGSYGAQQGSYGAQTGSYGAQAGLYGAQSGAYDSQRSSYESQRGSYGTGEFGVAGVGGASHRQEMEFEEHYENGQLVKGRKANKEWQDNQLVRHDEKHYGEGHSSEGGSSVFTNSLTGACSASPCQNGGSCITGARGYLCICPFGFRGLRCQEAYCPTRYCRHDGVCEVEGDGGHRCSCPVNFTGPRCERRERDRGTY